MPENPTEVCNYRNRGGAFVPFKGKSGCGTKEDKEVSQVPSLSLMPPMAAELGGSLNSNSKTNNLGCRGGPGSSLSTDKMKLPCKPQQQTQQQQQASRKQRRCWSPELHRRFIDALQQLGGSQGKHNRFYNSEN